MNKAYIRSFKGLSYDKCPFNIEENASTLCQDVISTPKGALSSPWGSTKWNETSLGFINGLYDYRNRRGGQYIIDYYSTSGAGYGATDYSTPPSEGGSTPTQTPDSSGNIDSNDGYSYTPIIRTAVVNVTGNMWDFACFGAYYGIVGYVNTYTVTVTVKKNGITDTTYNGTIKVRPTYGVVEGYTSWNITVTNGIGTTTNQYLYNSSYVLDHSPLPYYGNDTVAFRAYNADLSIDTTTNITVYYVWGSRSGNTASLNYSGGLVPISAVLYSGTGFVQWNDGSETTVTVVNGSGTITPNPPHSITGIKCYDQNGIWQGV